MRSFSVVLAWFFACLVVMIGEVQIEGVDTTMCRYRKFHKDFRTIRRSQMAESLPTGVYADPETGKAGEFTKKPKKGIKAAPRTFDDNSRGQRSVDSRTQRKPFKGDGLPQDDSKKGESRLMDNWSRYSVANKVPSSTPFLMEPQYSKYAIGSQIQDFYGAYYYNGVRMLPEDQRIQNVDIMATPIRVDYFQFNAGSMNNALFRNRLHQLYDNYAAISRMGNGQYLTEAQLWAFFYNAVHYVITMSQAKNFLHLYDKFKAIKDGDVTLLTFLQSYFGIHYNEARAFATNLDMARGAVDTQLETTERRVFVPNFGFLQYVADVARTNYLDDDLVRVSLLSATTHSRGWRSYSTRDNRYLQLYAQNGGSSNYIPGDANYVPGWAVGPQYPAQLAETNNMHPSFAKLAVTMETQHNLLHYFLDPLDWQQGVANPVYREPLANSGEEYLSPVQEIFGIGIENYLHAGFHVPAYHVIPDAQQIIYWVDQITQLAETLTIYATVGALNVFAPKASQVDMKPRDIKLTDVTRSYLKNRKYWGLSWFNTHIDAGTEANLVHNPDNGNQPVTANNFGPTTNFDRDNYYTQGRQFMELVYDGNSRIKELETYLLATDGVEMEDITEYVEGLDFHLVTFLNSKQSIKVRYSGNVSAMYPFPVNGTPIPPTIDPGTPNQFVAFQLVMPWVYRTAWLINNWDQVRGTNSDNYIMLSLSYTTNTTWGVCNKTHYYMTSNGTLSSSVPNNWVFCTDAATLPSYAINGITTPMRANTETFNVGYGPGGPETYFTKLFPIYNFIWEHLCERDGAISKVETNIVLTSHTWMDGTHVAMGNYDARQIPDDNDAQHQRYSPINVRVLTNRFHPTGKRLVLSKEQGQATVNRNLLIEGLLDVAEAYRVGNRMTVSPYYAYNFISGMGKPRT